ncbi:efflux transporter outer membrane subunit [Rudaea sp.]|uniref:efflux transporter outer membrane subunit n=1 Tax=Rudaea sp. TaxID=2136325 RepID=UPI002ECFEDB7
MIPKGTEARLGVLGGALLVTLAGCAAGPDFRPPAAPAVDGYRKDALPAATVETKAPTGDAQRFVSGADVPTQWWTTFANDELSRRITQALAHSPSVASAQAALRQAQENANAARGSLFPSVDVGVGATRSNANGAAVPGGGSVYTLYNAGAKVNYTLDLFGATRRGVEAESAVVDYQRFQLEGTYQTLAANVATASFREASLRGQIRATEEIIDVYNKELKLVEAQNQIGAKSLADVLVIRTQVATAAATLPPLRQQLAQTQTQLAVYLGEFPSQSELAALDLDAFGLPHDVPVSLPSTLTRQRADVRAAEATLHQATAKVGVATANLFPQITLSGSLGSSALHSDDLFSSGTKAWSIGANILQPIFHGGSLRAQKRAAEAGLDKAAADYEQTVLGAFQNVADALRALELDAENLKAQAQAEQSAAQSLELVRIQYHNGSASYLQELDATRQYQQTRLGLVQARAARLADTAALYTALGGGWKEDSEPVAAATPSASPQAK